MAFEFLKKPVSWLAGQTDFHADAPGTGPGQQAIRAQMNQIAGRGASQAYGMARAARGSSAPLALREAQRQAASVNQSAAQQGAIASGQLEQQRLQNIMEQQRINAGIAQGNAGGIMKLAGLAVGGAALASDERAKEIVGTGVLAMPERREESKPSGGLLGGILSDERSKAIGGTLMDANRGAQDAEAERRRQGVIGLSSYMQGNSDNPFMPSDARAKDLESENFELRKKLGAAASVGLGATLGPAASLASVGPLRDWARGGGQMSHTPTAGPAPLASQDTPALAPTEAQALAIVKAREEAKQKALERDLAASTEAQAAAANERQQIQAMPGSGGRTAELGRAISDERAKMYPSDADAKMIFPQGVKPVAFRYKPEAQAAFGEDNDMNVGLLAQDLEKSPEGATVVEEDPATGMKMVNTGKLTLLDTAKLSEMEKRLKKLEGKRA